ncbi:GntR family transcriptional regulator [Xylanibacillus composti]|uniref:GntR family transcriptional regulator n=1 Tax=Xylanibacillus composti TaxID=1572762 RepID=UPI001BCC96F5|nr:GntR family transcriptional regulator [Xylanibacillus composti]
MSRVANSGYLERKVYNEVKELIINGELKPGDLIIQDQIARRIGVSRTPLRRALAQLERDYLLESTPQGLVVRRISSGLLISVWEVRAALEGLACRLSAQMMDEATLVYLRTLITSAYKKWKEHGELEAYRKADVDFHTRLVQASCNPILHQNFTQTQVFALAFSKGIIRSPEETYPEHLAILDALEERNEEQAEKLMIEHLRKAIPTIRQSGWSDG